MWVSPGRVQTNTEQRFRCFRWNISHCVCCLQLFRVCTLCLHPPPLPRPPPPPPCPSHFHPGITFKRSKHNDYTTFFSFTKERQTKFCSLQTHFNCHKLPNARRDKNKTACVQAASLTSLNYVETCVQQEVVPKWLKLRS